PGQPNHVAFYSCGNASVETLTYGGAGRAPAPPGAGGGGNELHHVALGVDDLTQALGDLGSRRVRFQGDAPVTSVSRTMQMSAPASTGIVYQLIQWFPTAPNADLPPVDPPQRGGDGSGIGVTRLDHVGMLVADLASTRRFLTDTLRLAPSRAGEWPER